MTKKPGRISTSHPSAVILFNKPFGVLSQFTSSDKIPNLGDFIRAPAFYPAGRLDKDSEGLLILTNDGQIQKKITQPREKLPKTYWVQVEGEIDQEAVGKLEKGVVLRDGLTRPAKGKKIAPPAIWTRTPSIRQRKNIPTSWLELIITEGKNRQVRRMTAAVGFPTLRLIRSAVGPWRLNHLQPGQWMRLYLARNKQNKAIIS